MLVNPRRTDGVQSVWAASGGCRNGGVARRAFRKHADMALRGDALHIVVRDGTGELGMRRAVACLALQSTVAARHTVK